MALRPAQLRPTTSARTLFGVTDATPTPVHTFTSLSGATLHFFTPADTPGLWPITDEDGQQVAAFSFPAFVMHSFTDTDGVHYLRTPMPLLNDDLISIETALELAAIAFPDAQVAPATEEHHRLRRFAICALYLRQGRLFVSDLRASFKHPDRSKLVAQVTEGVDRLATELAEMGLSPSQIELATQLATSGLHPRQAWDTVHLVTD